MLRITKTKIQQIFSRMLTMTKIFEELFFSILNGLADRVWYVFSTLVVLGVGFNDLLVSKFNSVSKSSDTGWSCGLFWADKSKYVGNISNEGHKI